MKVGTTTVATVTTWSFTASQETLDITTLGDHDRKLVGGTRSVSGSASISWYSASGATAGQTQASVLMGKLLKTGGAASETVVLSLGISDHAGDEKVTTMSVVLTSIAMTSMRVTKTRALSSAYAKASRGVVVLNTQRITRARSS